MKERIASAIIASAIVFISLPGTLQAPAVLASVPSSLSQTTNYKLQTFVARLPLAAASAKPKKIVGPSGRESLGVKTTARRVYVVDERSGAELYGAAENEKMPIASITKLMTARVVRSRGLDWNKVVTIGSVNDGGGIAYFAPGDQVTIRDLWQTMLVGSSNAAAAILAKETGLSPQAFAAEMNANAAGLGMSNSSFVEPTGLDEKNISTAADVAILARAEFADPEVAAAVAIPYFDLVKKAGATKRVVSTDKLLGSFIARSPYKLIAGKTGYITESGYNIVISVTRENASPITVVVLGAASNDLRFQEAKSVAYWTFENYQWPKATAAAFK